MFLSHQNKISKFIYYAKNICRSIPFSKSPCLQTQILKVFSSLSLWPTTEYHRRCSGITALANKSPIATVGAPFSFGTQSIENRWHVLQSEPHSDSFVGEPIQSVLLQSTSSAPPRGSLVPIVFFVISLSI